MVGNGMVAEMPGSVLWDALSAITSLWTRKQESSGQESGSALPFKAYSSVTHFFQLSQIF